MAKLWNGKAYVDCNHPLTLPHPIGAQCDTCGDVLRWNGHRDVTVEGVKQEEPEQTQPAQLSTRPRLRMMQE